MKAPNSYSSIDVAILDDEADARRIHSALSPLGSPVFPAGGSDQGQMFRGVINGLGFSLILWQLLAVAIWWIL